MENFEKLNEAIVLREKGRAEDNQKHLFHNQEQCYSSY